MRNTTLAKLELTRNPSFFLCSLVGLLAAGAVAGCAGGSSDTGAAGASGGSAGTSGGAGTLGGAGSPKMKIAAPEVTRGRDVQTE